MLLQDGRNAALHRAASPPTCATARPTVGAACLAMRAVRIYAMDVCRPCDQHERFDACRTAPREGVANNVSCLVCVLSMQIENEGV